MGVIVNRDMAWLFDRCIDPLQCLLEGKEQAAREMEREREDRVAHTSTRLAARARAIARAKARVGAR